MFGLRNRLLASAKLCILCALGTTTAFAQPAYEFNLPQQSLADALRAIGRQTTVNILFEPDTVENLTAPPVRGLLSPEDAVRHVLLGTKLVVQKMSENSLLIALEPPQKALRVERITNYSSSVREARRDAGFRDRIRLAQVQSDETAGSAPVDRSTDAPEHRGILDEVVVTAQKREERLRDVPISISAYDQITMERRGMKDMSDVALATPGLNFSSEGVYNRITMRGIATGLKGGEGIGGSTTAIYVDDIPIQAKPIDGGGVHNSATPKIFDLERVEVLRGPQGTLFGGGAVGGAVRFITPQPSLTEYSGYSRAEISDTDGGGLSNEFGAALGGPIIEDKLGFRVSGSYSHNGGFIDHISTIPGAARERNSDRSDSYVAHAALTFAPTDYLRLTPAIRAQSVKARDITQFSLLDSGPGEFLVTTPLLSPIEDEFYIPSFKVEVDFDAASLTSISSYFDRNFSNDIDYSFTIPAAFGAPLPTTLDRYEITRVRTTQENFVQEVRLSSADPAARLQWTVGGYYSDSRTHGLQVIEAPSFPEFVLEQFGSPIEDVLGMGLVDGLYSYYVDNTVRSKDLAGYINLEYELLERISLVAGVRVSRLEEEYDLLQMGPLGGILQTREGIQRESPVTPKFGINFKPNDDTLLYVSAAKGFRGGGVNKSIPTTGDACRAAMAALGTTSLATYDSDSLWSYELGYKGGLFDDRLRIDASAYHIDWKDIQSAVTVAECLGGFIANFNEAQSNGFDIALDARITDNLNASLAVGYTDAEFTRTSEFNGRIHRREGDQLSDIPPWTISASLQYSFPVSPTADGYIRVENRYASRNDGPFSFQDPESATFSTIFVVNDSTNQLNVRTGVELGKVEISLFATNVLNDQPLLNGIRSRTIAEYGASTIRPRTIGITGVYRW